MLAITLAFAHLDSMDATVKCEPRPAKTGHARTEPSASTTEGVQPDMSANAHKGSRVSTVTSKSTRAVALLAPTAPLAL